VSTAPLASAAAPVLWHLEVSHYNEKVRWALDYKGVPHVRRAITPGLQAFRVRRLRAGRTTPVLEIDGQMIGDSSTILAEIERRWPDPPLYPSDPDERGRALELEEFFDERCGHDLRRVLFYDNMSEPDTFVAILMGRDHPQYGLFTRLAPVMRPVVKSRYRLEPEPVEQSRQAVRAAIGRIEAEAGPDGYLVGDSFTVADLTAASILTLLVVPPQFPYIKLPPEERTAAWRAFRDSLKDRPGFQWVLDVYARHRGTSAEVPEAAAA
jgi:glutathione S-transferase